VPGDPEFPGHPVVYQDEFAIAFLTTNPTQYGYALVCPKEHREQATGDFSMEEYLGLQRLVYGVAEAVREEVGAERMYVFSLGSNQGNAHVHWHVVPLPPGVPYERQQFAALMLESAGGPQDTGGGEGHPRSSYRSKTPTDLPGLAGAPVNTENSPSTHSAE
jgi:diadenosine tetraphosphate (Ap4A) HIT family hydrolase